MRRRGFKLIRKTPVWLHRLKGTSSLHNKDKKSLNTLCLYGELSVSDEGEIIGVGDRTESIDEYAIKIKTHGRNLISGKDFFTIHKNLGLSSSATLSSDYYTVNVSPSANGRMIIDRSHIAFKEGTSYTVCAYMWYVHTTSNGIRNLRMSFEYSDGTSTPMTVKNNSYKFYVCVSSTPGKTLVGISSYADLEQQCRIGVQTFGIFEGAYSQYENCYEAYEAEEKEILLSEPLFRVGYSKDELDLINGILTRRNRRCLLDASNLESTDNSCEYRILLPEPMKTGMKFICSYPQYSETNNSDPVSVYPSEDGEYIYFVCREDITLDDLRDSLSTLAVDICYPIRDIKEEELENSARITPSHEYISICTAVKPHLLIAEYT